MYASPSLVNIDLLLETLSLTNTRVSVFHPPKTEEPGYCTALMAALVLVHANVVLHASIPSKPIAVR